MAKSGTFFLARWLFIGNYTKFSLPASQPPRHAPIKAYVLQDQSFVGKCPLPVTAQFGGQILGIARPLSLGRRQRDT